MEALKTFVKITACIWLVSGLLPGRCFAGEIGKGAPAVFQLGRVLVTGTREGPGTGCAVTEIGEEEMRSWGVRTAGEALDHIPGLDVHTGGQGRSLVNIRGFASKEVKVLIDGVPAGETFSGVLDLSQIPVDSIARIVVVRGAASVLYGADTLGGVINIITKKGGKAPVTGLSTSFGDYDTQGWVLDHGASEGSFNYWLTAGYWKSRGFRLSRDFDSHNEYLGEASPYHEDGGSRDLSYYQKRNLNLKLGYEPDDGSMVYLSLDYHNNERGCPPENDRYQALTKWDQWHLNLAGQKRMGDRLTVKGRLFYVDHADTLSDVGWDGHRTARKAYQELRNDDHSAGGEIRGSLDLGGPGLLSAGLSYVRENHREREYLDAGCTGVKKGKDLPGWQAEKEFETHTLTVALEDEIRPAGRLSLVFGASYDYFEPLRAGGRPLPGGTGSWNPQAVVVYRPSADTSLHASIGKKTRFPHLRELYSRYTGGNPGLGPEEAVIYDIGIEKGFSRGRIWADCFYNDVRDMIQRVDRKGGWIYDNIGRAVLQGTETGLEILPFSNLRLRCDYTFLSARDMTLGRDIPRRPRHKVNLEVGLALPFEAKVDLIASYTASQVEYLDGGSSHRLDDFFLVDLGLEKTIRLPRSASGKIFLNVKNIMDVNYNDGHGPMPGRDFVAGLRLGF